VCDLEATLRAIPADVVVDATPASLARLVTLDTPMVDVRYEFRERGDILWSILERFERKAIVGRSPVEQQREAPGSP
jgi:predicted GTPase